MHRSANLSTWKIQATNTATFEHSNHLYKDFAASISVNVFVNKYKIEVVFSLVSFYVKFSWSQKQNSRSMNKFFIFIAC